MATSNTQGTGRLRVPPRRLSDPHNHVSITPVATQAPESDYGSDLDFDDLLDDSGRLVTRSQEILEDIRVGNGALPGSFQVATDDPPLLSGQPSQYTDGSIYYSSFGAMPGLDPLIQQPSEPLLYPTINGTIATTGEYPDIDSAQETTSDSMNALYNPPPQNGDTISSSAVRSPDTKTALLDPRPPIERFRSKRGLSVTDMVSPAWCELQFFFTMAIRGKRKDTSAMKKGREVHAQLEAEVHSFVPVAVATKEERWGLKIWNTIQGLRTLRQTGMTRELEVFGMLDGELILGVIDELTHTCPDSDLEASINKKGTQAHIKAHGSQKVMEQFFQTNAPNQTTDTWIGQPEDHDTRPKIYIGDTKTTGRNGVPPESYIKAARMQLMLYRQLLVAIASNQVPADAFFDKYGLDPQADFSGAFIGEIAALDAQFAPSSQASELEATFNTPEASASELHAYHNLTLLWSAMIQEFMITIPNAEETVGHVLNLEYRKSSDGSLIGNRAFPYDAQEIDGYIKDVMNWWKGRRSVKGVEIEDAFKCRSCEFAEGCEWRINKVEEAVKRSRSRSSGLGKKKNQQQQKAKVGVAIDADSKPMEADSAV